MTFFLMLLKPFVAFALMLPGALAARWLSIKLRDGKLKRLLMFRVNGSTAT